MPIFIYLQYFTNKLNIYCTLLFFSSLSEPKVFVWRSCFFGIFLILILGWKRSLFIFYKLDLLYYWNKLFLVFLIFIATFVLILCLLKSFSYAWLFSAAFVFNLLSFFTNYKHVYYMMTSLWFRSFFFYFYNRIFFMRINNFKIKELFYLRFKSYFMFVLYKLNKAGRTF